MSKGMTIGLVALGAVVLFFLVGGFSCYSWVNGLRNDGITKERALSAQYLDNQNHLSAFISGFHEQVGLAEAQSDKVNTILEDAVKGRYEGQGGGYTVDSPFFNAIFEAYPEASLEQLLENWGKIQDYVVAQRGGYRNVQSKLLDMIREYDTWRETGFVKSAVVRQLGFPSNRLEARIGDTVVVGEAARQKMLQIILTKAAKDAYESGEMEPLQVPKR